MRLQFIYSLLHRHFRQTCVKSVPFQTVPEEDSIHMDSSGTDAAKNATAQTVKSTTYYATNIMASWRITQPSYESEDVAPTHLWSRWRRGRMHASMSGHRDKTLAVVVLFFNVSALGSRSFDARLNVTNRSSDA